MIGDVFVVSRVSLVLTSEARFLCTLSMFVVSAGARSSEGREKKNESHMIFFEILSFLNFFLITSKHRLALRILVPKTHF